MNRTTHSVFNALLLLFLFFPEKEVCAQQHAKWFKIFGSYSADAGTSVLSDTHENVYVTGNFSDDMTVGNIHLVPEGGFDIFLLKLDSAGEVKWAVSYGGPFDDEPKKLTFSSDGSLLLTGYFSDSCNFVNQKKKAVGVQDMFIAKINVTDGLPEWIQTAGSRYGYTNGNTICGDKEGNILSAGVFGGKCFFGKDSVVSKNNSLDFFIAKYQSDGKLLWTKSYGGNGNDDLNGISTDAETNIFVCGSFEDTMNLAGNTIISKGQSDMYWGKLDNEGNALWFNSAGSPGADHAWNIAALPDGKFFLTAWFNDTLSLEGILLNDNGNGDILIARFFADGQLDWVRSGYNKNAPDYIRDLAVDKNGGAYITGLSNFYVERLEEPGNRIEYPNSLFACPYGDMVVIKYDSAGNMKWLEHTLGNNLNMATGVTVDNRGNCYATGYFTDSISYHDDWRKGNGGSDIWVLKFSDSTFFTNLTLLQSETFSAEIFPNPASETAFLKIKSTVPTDAAVSIMDLSGRKMQQYAPAKLREGVTIHTFQPGLPPGFYLINIQAGGQSLVLKFVIQ